MTLAHLLTASMLLCSLPGLAQNLQAFPPPENTQVQLAAKPAAILPRQSHQNDPTQAFMNGLERYKVDAFRVTESGEIIATASINPLASPLPNEESKDDNTCFSIRSYVVARDRKDSDSTHFVRYSTCQPASRYRLRTTQLQERSSDR